MAEHPRFLSLEFHLRFLPGVIRRRLRPAPRSGFGPALEFSLLITVCAVLLAIGIPGVIGSSPGWISAALTLAGAIGFATLVFISVRSELGQPLSYERFEPGVFFFVVTLGTTVGLWTGIFSDPDRNAGAMYRLDHSTEHFLWTVAGAVLGYLLGIPAGLWMQKLGPMSAALTVWAVPGIVGLIVTDAVILSA